MTEQEFADHYALLNRGLVRSMTFKFGRESGEDVAQQAWMKAFRHRASFRGESAFATWLTRIAVNEGIMMARADRCQPAAQAAELTRDVMDAVAHDDRTERRLIAEQETRVRTPRVLVNVVRRDVRQRYADIYRMRFVVGTSVKATAAALGMNENTVKTYASRIRLKLTRR